MKAFNLKYNRMLFWEEYWKVHGIDPAYFITKDIYPIKHTLRAINKTDRILECGFGSGRVLQHLSNMAYDVIGIENDKNIVNIFNKELPHINANHGDILNLNYDNGYFDSSLAFGVIGTLNNKMARGLTELRRVTKINGTLVISVMLDNLARNIQYAINSLFSNEKKDFYSWINDINGWKSYFESFNFKIQYVDPIISRYNIYYWNPFLRSLSNTHLSLARVDEREYKLNIIGEMCWLLHKYIFKKQLSGGIVFTLKKL